MPGAHPIGNRIRPCNYRLLEHKGVYDGIVRTCDGLHSCQYPKNSKRIMHPACFSKRQKRKVENPQHRLT
jgi:hypothetical protein